MLAVCPPACAVVETVAVRAELVRLTVPAQVPAALATSQLLHLLSF
jgi:hypothetical protein